MSNSDFTPEFGPNGAVMNSPTMTPELRSDYTREASVRRSLLRAMPFPLILLASVGLQLTIKPPLSTTIWVVLPVVFFVLRGLPRSGKRGD